MSESIKDIQEEIVADFSVFDDCRFAVSFFVPITLRTMLAISELTNAVQVLSTPPVPAVSQVGHVKKGLWVE